MILRFVLTIIALAAIIGGLAGVKVSQIQMMIAAGENTAPPEEAVASAIVERVVWQQSLASVGTLEAVRGVAIQAELPGIVKEVGFENGERVQEGQVLVQLDTSTEEAQLKAAQADAELARIEYRRAVSLRESESVPQSQVDQSRAQLERAEAEIQRIETLLEKLTIRAPFDGKVGLRRINLGQYITSGQTIVDLQSFDPIFVNFSLPQQQILSLNEGMAVEVTTTSIPDRTFSGQLTAISPTIDEVTRNIRLQATLDNSEEMLRPGMFARVEIILNEEQEHLIIPATAILSAPYGDSVFVINHDSESGKPTVQQQFVRIGERRGDFVSVTSGLREGQEVVSAGAFKLRNGMTVVINNELAPSPEVSPDVEDS